MIKEFDNIAIMAGERNISYSELLDYIHLYAQYTPSQAGEKTIIFSENREGWIFAFFSIWQNHGLAVPVDASSTVSDVAYILNDCHPTCIWTSKGCLEVAQQAVAQTGLDIRILLIDEYEKVPLKGGLRGAEGSGNTFSFSNHEAALIIYTSGTTGSPKGVMLSYANLYSNMYSVTNDVPIFRPDRRTLILLPLHHVLPLVGTVVIPIITGGGVAICPSMSGPDIMETLVRGKIGIFIGVPRLWQTLYAGIKKKIDASALTRALFNICARLNCRPLSRFIFQSVHKKMGGHIAYFVSGGAALDTEISRGLRTLGINLLEGYGMTETAPIISFTRPGDIIPGCVGLPMSTVDVKIVDGEICAKGPNVMLGYYNRPEETAAVIDKDGYVHTGDLGFLDKQGRIHITGRSKEIIVLSNGKNVQPNEIEYKLEKYDKLVKEVAVTQDGDRLLAIIVPQPEWAATLTDAQVEEALKRQVIEPYNLTVTNYKKIMSIFVYRGDLPRTKLDKLQRFKLKDLMAPSNSPFRGEKVASGFPLKGGLRGAEGCGEVFSILATYISSEKHVPVRPTDHIETDLALDSLDRVGLQSFIEQTFGVEMKADTFVTFPNVQAIAQQIEQTKTRMEVEDVDWSTIVARGSSQLSLPSTSPFLTCFSSMFRGFLRMHNHLQIKGVENIPTTGQFILAPNHQSYIDGPICTSGMDSQTVRRCYFYATEEHVRGSIRRYLARHNNVILMEKKNLKNSILTLAEVLKQGKNIIIFPEGTRTHDGTMAPFKKAFAILSRELNVPIVPVRITGAFDAMPRGTRFPSTHPITVEYLPPITPQPTETYDQLSDRVRRAIAEA